MAVSNVLQERYGYDTGAFERFSHDTDSDKGLFKLDWNINDNNSLTATYYNYLNSFQRAASGH